MKDFLNSARLWSFIAISTLLFMPLASPASEESKTKEIIELMKISGIYDMLESSYQESKRHAESIRDLNKRDLQGQFKTLPDGYWEVEEAAFRRMEKELEPFDYSTDAYVGKWAEFYGEELSQQDVEEILQYYKSEIGRKDLAAQVKAAEKWNVYMMKDYQEAVNNASNNYNSTISDYVNEYVRTMQNQSK